jgi:hypothetical protein
MVVFDLQAMELVPRFSHVSRYIGAPDDVLPRCSPQTELAQWYMDEYVRWGGDRVATDEFLEETWALWLDEAVCLPNRWRGQIVDGRPDFHGILHALLRKLWDGTM